VALLFSICAGLLKNKYTLLKIYFTKNADAKSIHIFLCTDGKKISQISDIDDLKRCITEAVAAVTCDML
jgi:hypothetical protein